MNLFRLIADMLHLAAICTLLYRIKVVRNCLGKSSSTPTHFTFKYCQPQKWCSQIEKLRITLQVAVDGDFSEAFVLICDILLIVESKRDVLFNDN